MTTIRVRVYHYESKHQSWFVFSELCSGDIRCSAERAISSSTARWGRSAECHLLLSPLVRTGDEGAWCLQCLTVCLYIEQYIPPPANAVMLLVVALLYFYHVKEHNVSSSLYPVYFLYIIVGLELLFAVPCLIYYIGEQWSEIVQFVSSSTCTCSNSSSCHYVQPSQAASRCDQWQLDRIRESHIFSHCCWI